MAFSIKVLAATAQRNLRVISPYKVYNAAKVASSFYISRKLKKPVRWGRPVILMVEPTNLCNLKCPLCPSGNGDMKRKTGNMDIELYKKVIGELKDTLFLVMFWNQGEPFINKSLLEMVSIAHKAKLGSVISTNGHFIRSKSDAAFVIDSGLSEMIVSLDGASQETYEKYRIGGDYNQVIEGIKFLVEEKKSKRSRTPIIHLQFLLFKHNSHEIDRIRTIAVELGADKLSYKTAQVYTDEEAVEFLPEDSSMNRYEMRHGTRMLKADWKSGCKRIWFTAMVNWDGSLAPCCYDKDIDFLMGNANEESVPEIWNSEKFETFRKRVLLLRPTIEMCRNCAEGLQVQQFNQVEWIN